MANVQTSNEADILARVIAPESGNFSAEFARALLDCTFPDVDIQRMNELAAKNRSQEATEAELEELERYSRVGNLLNLLQSKARRSLGDG